MATTPVAATSENPSVEQVEESQNTGGVDMALESDDDDADFSLADIAGLDISEIEEIRTERLPVGAYLFRGKGAKLSEMTNRDDERRIVATVTLEVAEVHAITEKGYTESDVLGKTHSERFFIVPEKAQEGIGRIRAWYADVGLDNKGPLGGMIHEGVPPGVLDRIEDHLFPAKITARKQDGETYARLKLPPRKKQG